MYPILRFTAEMLRARRLPPIGVRETHVSHHRCWPWDIDPWMELNNGRTLTLYDLGRVPLAVRTGLIGTARANGWFVTVAGLSTRYRRRVTPMARFQMRSRILGWDARFIYIEQSIWLGAKTEIAANQALLRMAVASKDGLVPTQMVAEALGWDTESPTLPDWVQAWIAAEDQRPWPPEDMPDDAPGAA